MFLSFSRSLQIRCIYVVAFNSILGRLAKRWWVRFRDGMNVLTSLTCVAVERACLLVLCVWMSDGGSDIHRLVLVLVDLSASVV